MTPKRLLRFARNDGPSFSVRQCTRLLDFAALHPGYPLRDSKFSRRGPLWLSEYPLQCRVRSNPCRSYDLLHLGDECPYAFIESPANHRKEQCSEKSKPRQAKP